MAVENITILTVNWFSSGLINELFKNLRDKVANPDSLSFLVVDNTNGKDEQLHKSLSSEQSVNILRHNPEKLSGLSAHASGINFGFSHIETEYILLVDPDIHLFKEDWKTFFTEELKKKQLDAIGTAFPSWWIGTYHNFPSPIFCFAKTSSLKKINANWLPEKTSMTLRFRNFLMRHILRGGFVFNRRMLFKHPKLRKFTRNLEKRLPISTYDTGYPLSLQARNGKIDSETFAAIFDDELDSIVNLDQLNTNACAELASQYEIYTHENEIILTHQYGSQNFLLKTSKGSDREHWRESIAKIRNS